MADWLQQYTASLVLRDEHEQAHKSYIDAYTKLADRTAVLEAAVPDTPASPPRSEKQGSQAAPDRPDPKRSASNTAPTQQVANTDTLTRLRADLTTTQRSRTDLQSQLARLQTQLSQLTTQSSASTQRITALEREKRDLERKLRDRDEELRGKARLVESVQDEMVGLNLQMNMAEQKAERLNGENEDLVRRWMERMGVEAERMNVESRWK